MCYWAAILDLFSRKVIGYALSLSLEASFAMEALTMAIEIVVRLQDCIHHSDRVSSMPARTMLIFSKNMAL